MSLQELTHMLKGHDKWLIAKPKRHKLMGRTTYQSDLTYKTDILGALGNIIKDDADHEIIMSAISKIIAYYEKGFPDGFPKSKIADASTLPTLVTHPSNPNNVTVKSLILARLKKNLVGGLSSKNEPDSGDLGAYNFVQNNIRLNVGTIPNNINNSIIDSGKYNYVTDEDYIHAEVEHIYIHEMLHAISDNDTFTGFMSMSSGVNRGINEATTEHIANAISNPKRYSRRNNILFKTSKMTFMSNIDSSCGYSHKGIVNLMHLATGEGQVNKSVHESYLLGDNASSLFSTQVIDAINDVYEYADSKHNLLAQVNKFFGTAMDSYYESKGIPKSQKPTSTKNMTITYVDRQNVSHNINVVCDMYAGGICRYSIPDPLLIDKTAASNSFTSQKLRQNLTVDDGKIALANLICAHLNSSNTSPYTNIALNFTDIKSQPSFIQYMLCAKAQDGITNDMFVKLRADIAKLNTNFTMADFRSIMNRLDKIGDNLVYAIPNDTTNYSIRNTGYLNKIILASSVPTTTLREYHTLRQSLLKIAQRNESKLNPTHVKPQTYVTIDGIDIILQKDKSNRYVLASNNPAGNLSALYTKLKAYPNINTNPKADDKFLRALVEDLINNGIAFNEQDEFYNNYVSRYTIPNHTIATYINNEKYPNKSYIMTNNIICKFKGKEISVTLPVKYNGSTKDKDKLFLSSSTLNKIQSTLQTPYTTTELNAILSEYLGHFVSSTNSIDFELNCDLEDRRTKQILSNSVYTRFVSIDKTVVPMDISIINEVCVIGTSTTNKIDSYIDAHLSKGRYATTYNQSKDKKQIVEAIRLGFNRYVHNNNLNTDLRNAVDNKTACTIDIDHMIEYCVANNNSIKQSLTTPQNTNNNPNNNPPSNTPSNNPSGNTSGSNNNGGNNAQPQTPQDYFRQYIDHVGKFTYCPYSAYAQSISMAYYYQLFYQYQYMQYYQYMMSFYGGYINYPYIQNLNMGATCPGAIMYQQVPGQNYCMPYYYNGQAYTNNIAQAGDSNMSSQQMLQLNNMIKTAPSSEIGDTIMSLTKAIQELQAKLDNLEKANKPNLNKLSEMNATFDIPSNIDKNNGMGGM